MQVNGPDLVNFFELVNSSDFVKKLEPEKDSEEVNSFELVN